MENVGTFIALLLETIRFLFIKLLLLSIYELLELATSENPPCKFILDLRLILLYNNYFWFPDPFGIISVLGEAPPVYFPANMLKFFPARFWACCGGVLWSMGLTDLGANTFAGEELELFYWLLIIPEFRSIESPPMAPLLLGPGAIASPNALVKCLILLLSMGDILLF